MHFIICEDDKKFVERCKKIIFRIMSGSKLSYDTISVSSWDNEVTNLVGNKVYICGEISNKKGIDLAKVIRNKGDWYSPIIVVMNQEEFRKVCYKSKLLTLDYIFKDEDVDKNLFDALDIACKINSCCSCLCIAKNSELYQISFDDILYIEKRLNENYSTIVTEKGEFLIKKSIVSLYEQLMYRNFYKTHRSCIVNINKIKMVDFDRSIIKFKDKQIDLISRSNKKGLKEKMECR